MEKHFEKGKLTLFKISEGQNGKVEYLSFLFIKTLYVGACQLLRLQGHFRYQLVPLSAGRWLSHRVSTLL